MKPGATASPDTSISIDPRSCTSFATRTILSFETATSPMNGIPPLPSYMVPPRKTMSKSFLSKHYSFEGEDDEDPTPSEDEDGVELGFDGAEEGLEDAGAVAELDGVELDEPALELVALELVALGLVEFELAGVELDVGELEVGA